MTEQGAPGLFFAPTLTNRSRNLRHFVPKPLIAIQAESPKFTATGESTSALPEKLGTV